MNKKKGFTLAELLIVVAIIAVLVGVAIPVFTAQLEKSRESVDLANIRSAYASCTTAVMTELNAGEATYDSTAKSASQTVKLTQKDAGWSSENGSVKIGGKEISSVPSSGSVKVTVTAAGVTDIVATP